jgi:3',5'-cyclic AMP phosphodiesterase CpdA
MVTDGLDVVTTSADGEYTLVTWADREFVNITVPAGHRIPVHPTGTARFYHPLLPNTEGEAEVNWDLEPLAESDERHNVLLLADPQTENEQEMAWFHERSVPDVQSTVSALGDAETIGIACGDIMYDQLELYPEYERGVQRIGVPFFQVVGNHDLDLDGLTDEASTGTFTRHFGPPYYSFERGAVHYVVLDDVFWFGRTYLGYIGAQQLLWLENDLARVEPGRTVVVAMHIPALGGQHVRDGRQVPDDSVAIANREALYRLLEPYRAHVLVGHTHEHEHVFEHGVHEHVHGTVCGAWWSGPICWDGTPNGYAVYEVAGESLTWRYKSTGFDARHQMRLYPPGSDPLAPDDFVANIWDWDPEWRVVWYEDETPRGVMGRRRGLDPLSVELHAGEELPHHRPWVDPRPTDHLFYAAPSPEAGQVRVEATDRFGRSYSEVLTLPRP